MEATKTSTVQTFGKLRGTHRWVRLFSNGEIQWGVGQQVFAQTASTDREAAVASIEAWIAGGIWNG